MRTSLRIKHIRNRRKMRKEQEKPKEKPNSTWDFLDKYFNLIFY